MQHVHGGLWAVEDAGGEHQAVPAAWRGRYRVVGGVRCCLRDLAVVVPLHCAPGVPVFEDLYFRGDRGCVHRVPANELDGADHGMGFRERSHEEDVE